MHSLASTLSNSGLFFESQLRERRPISTSDLKRRLLEVIDARREGPAVDDAWAALDDLVGLQSAATAANRSGGTVVSSALMVGTLRARVSVMSVDFIYRTNFSQTS